MSHQGQPLEKEVNPVVAIAMTCFTAIWVFMVWFFTTTSHSVPHFFWPQWLT